MLRYHKKVYFNDDDLEILKSFTMDLNELSWSYTKHCLDNLKYRTIDLEQVLLFIRDLVLNFRDIFEFYKDDIIKKIVKVCYRVSFNKEIDLILVIGENKQIITIYTNSSDDEHITLKKELYINEV